VFTGIVQAIGILARVEETAYGRQFCLSLPSSFWSIPIGASLNVDGVCLTCVGIEEQGLLFDVIHQSLQVTNLIDRHVGDKLNCERSLCFGGEVGGHIVSGHISVKGKILSINADSGAARLKIALTRDWMRYIFDKGFISVDGVSLTVAAADMLGNFFEIALIPETVRSTAFLEYSPGEHVNVEIESQTKILVDIMTGIRER
jgi:riboflavin synthase